MQTDHWRVGQGGGECHRGLFQGSYVVLCEQPLKLLLPVLHGSLAFINGAQIVVYGSSCEGSLQHPPAPPSLLLHLTPQCLTEHDCGKMQFDRGKCVVDQCGPAPADMNCCSFYVQLHEPGNAGARR